MQAISYCDEDFMIQLQGPHLDKAEEVTDPILLNMAAAQLKTGEYALAAHNSTQVSSSKHAWPYGHVVWSCCAAVSTVLGSLSSSAVSAAVANAKGWGM